MRAATRSEIDAPAAISTAIGTKARPALVAENPNTFCRYSEV